MKKFASVLDEVICDTCNKKAKVDSHEYQGFVEVKNENINIDLCEDCFSSLVEKNLTLERKASERKGFDMEEFLKDK